MAEYVVAHLPVGYDVICQRVVARDVESLDEKPFVAGANLAKLVVIRIDDKSVERCIQKHKHQCGHSLFGPYLEKSDNAFHLFLRKYLTNMKFMGTQMQNIGISARRFSSPK